MIIQKHFHNEIVTINILPQFLSDMIIKSVTWCTMSSLQRMWKDHDLYVQTKKRIVETMVFPVATYGAESWTVIVDL